MATKTDFSAYLDAVIECVAFARSWQFARSHEGEIRKWVGGNYAKIPRQDASPVAQEACEAWLESLA